MGVVLLWGPTAILAINTLGIRRVVWSQPDAYQTKFSEECSFGFFVTKPLESVSEKGLPCLAINPWISILPGDSPGQLLF